MPPHLTSRITSAALTASLVVVALAATVPAALASGEAAPTAKAELRGTVASGEGRSAVALAGARLTAYRVSPGGSRAIGTAVADARGRFVLRTSGAPTFVLARDHHRVLATLLSSERQRTVAVNELTTVAAAYATAQLASGTDISGTPLQLVSASGMAANLVSPVTGRPSQLIQTSPNGDETNAWRELGTLANILASCVRESAMDADCARLFALTRTTRTRTTWAAVRAIALNPARNVQRLFALGDTVHAYRPYLRTDQGPQARNRLFRLDAFTLAVKLNATGRTQDGTEVCPFGGLGNIAFNLDGYAWITNNVVQGTPGSANCIVVLRPDGRPSTGVGGTPDSPLLGGGILGQGFGIGFDPSGRVWSGNFGWGGAAYEPTLDGSTPGGSVSLFTGSGTAISGPFGYPSNGVFRVQGTVSDAQGNVWLASYGTSSVQVLPSGDPSTAFPSYADGNLEPFDIRLDAQGDAWVSYTQSSTLSKLHYTPTGVQNVFTKDLGKEAMPKGVAVDSQGNGWVASGPKNTVFAFSSNGASLGSFDGGGIVGPWGISTDSADTLWVANFGNIRDSKTKFGVSRLCGSVPANCRPGAKLGDPMTPSTGYTLPSAGKQVLLHSGAPLNGEGSKVKVFKPLMRETAVQPDAAGNLWVTNNWKPGDAADATNPGGDGLVIFVGVAAPVAPKLYSGPSTRP